MTRAKKSDGMENKHLQGYKSYQTDQHTSTNFSSMFTTVTVLVQSINKV